MTFQFKCPQGCLLEGEAEQAGQTIQCPVCSTLFIIPPPPTAQPAPPAAEAPPAFATSAPPALQSEPVATSSESDEPPPETTPPAQAAYNPADEESEKLLHIPCPNGHELETPPDLLNQEVFCPHCSVQFLLREQNSVEFKRRKAIEQHRREQRIGNAWLNWAVVIAVIVVLGLLFLIANSMLR